MKILYQIIFVTLINFIYTNISMAEENAEYLLQAETYEKLIQVQELLQSGKYSETLNTLNNITNINELPQYDQAVIYQLYGYAENGHHNINKAIDYFKKSLSFNALPEKVNMQIEYSLALILISENKYQDGLKYLNLWFSKSSEDNYEAEIIAATAYYELKDYKSLIPHAEKAIKLNKNAPLSWHELLLAAYMQTKGYQPAIPTLELLISQKPENKNYWLQLAYCHQQLKQEHAALAVYELAYRNGLFEANDILNLAKTYLYLDLPFKAGSIIDREIQSGVLNADTETLKLMADSWLLAKENNKAIEVFKKIIITSDTEESRLRLGQLYIETEEWQEAEKVLNTKLESEDKSLKAKIKLLLGIAQANLKNDTAAINALTYALSDESTRNQANWWLKHIENRTKDKQDNT